MAVAPLFTAWGVLGVMAPLLPAEGVTVQVWRFAWQFAFVPPFDPAHVHVQGPEPLTEPVVPALQRLVLGAEVKLPPLAEPHWPFTGSPVKVADTVQLAVTGFVV